MKSWTSGVIAAVGAIGAEPGDEVIVSPWTMSASATAILHWNAIPVFADIERETFNLDPKSVEANISPYTKAIMTIDRRGTPCISRRTANDHIFPDLMRYLQRFLALLVRGKESRARLQDRSQ